MSRVVATKRFLIDTEVGATIVTEETVEGYDVEDIISDRAFSQATVVQLVNIGKTIDPNSRIASRTLGSRYRDNDEELDD